MQIRVGYENGIVYLSFPFNKEVIDLIKEHGDAMFDYNKKRWKLNLSTKEMVVKVLKEKGFTVVENEKYKRVFK